MDPLTIGLIAGGSAGLKGLSGLYNANQQRIARKYQNTANEKARGQITDAYGKAQEYFTPYQEAGAQGLARLTAMQAPGQYQSQEMQPQYQAQEFNYQEDPGMAYRMKTGQDAIQGGAAAQGAGLSGATQKALGKFGQELGSQEYGNAYDRYMRGRQQGYQEHLGGVDQYNRNRLFGADQQQQQFTNRLGLAGGLADYGQNAARSLGSMASNYGNSMAGLYGQQGDIGAAAAKGRAQNFSQTLGGMANSGMDAILMSQMGE